MSKFVSIAILAAVAVASPVLAAESSQSVRAETEVTAASPSVTAGRMIYGGNGQRIAPAYRVASDGTVQVILNGKLVNIPSASLSEVNGKVQTTLTKVELGRAH